MSGGEPTLRKRSDSVAIVARIAALGMRATLYTNGIKATRGLLTELCQAGLTDVAFHVDTTQERAGYPDEASLNALRSKSVGNARGLPLGIFFNTTVHAGNFDDVPMLAAWFVANADAVRPASFQLQADTGRGVLCARAAHRIGNDTVTERLRRGADVPTLGFNTLAAGHHDCSSTAVLLVVNGKAHGALAERRSCSASCARPRLWRPTAGMPNRALLSPVRAALSNPGLALASASWALAWIWRLRRDLFVARGRLYKLRCPEARRRNDPRIHFALNCSALSCPVLPRTPFTAEDLDAQLERATRAFFAEPRNFRIDATTRTVWLSELLNFYPEDFVPNSAASLLDCANRYAPRPAPVGHAVQFTPYDWTVANSRRAR